MLLIMSDAGAVVKNAGGDVCPTERLYTGFIAVL
jgi:hypothetical protein